MRRPREGLRVEPTPPRASCRGLRCRALREPMPAHAAPRRLRGGRWVRGAAWRYDVFRLRAAAVFSAVPGAASFGGLPLAAGLALAWARLFCKASRRLIT